MIKERHIRPYILALWGETINRLDAVLLEIRHVQFNIIEELREPDLYQVLQYEENYLWGRWASGDLNGGSLQDWREILSHHGLTCVDSLVNAWVIKVAPKSILKDEDRWKGLCSKFGEYFDAEKFMKISTCADNIYATRDISRGFGPVLSHLYMTFSVLQTLKANILRDKLIFCYWAHRASLREVPINKKIDRLAKIDIEAIGRFFTIRSGVIFRMSKYISTLEDLRTPAERNADITETYSTRSTFTRRREQGGYNEYLTQRSLRYHRVLEKTLRSTKDISDNKPIRAFVSHRWVYSGSSEYDDFKDETVPPLHEYEEPYKNYSHHHHFLNTSFWMVDRPDLQPILAHESAHYFMNYIFDEMGESSLKYSGGNYAKLFRNLSLVFLNYQNPMPGNKEFPLENLEILREMGVDLLASSRNPVAYLWAVFLEIIGLDLFEMLETQDSACDLNVLESAERAGFVLRWRSHDMYDNHLWSIRLLGVCQWVESIDPALKNNPLGKELISVIRLFVKVLLEYIESKTPIKILNGRGKNFLNKLIRHVEEEIKASDVVITLKNNLQEIRKESDLVCSGSSAKEYNSELYLTPQVRTKISEWMYDLKSCRHSDALPKSDKGIYQFDKFVELYFGNTKKNGKNIPTSKFIQDYNIFQSVHDIPWTSYILRGLDLDATYFSAMAKEELCINDLCRDFDPGSDLYLLIHEHQTWLRSRPLRRLSRTVRLVADLLQCVGIGLLGGGEKVDFVNYWINSEFPSANKSTDDGGDELIKAIWRDILPKLYKWITAMELKVEGVPISSVAKKYEEIYLSYKEHEDSNDASPNDAGSHHVFYFIQKSFEKNGEGKNSYKLKQVKPIKRLVKLKEFLSGELAKLREDFDSSTVEIFASPFYQLLSYLEVNPCAETDKDKLDKVSSDILNAMEISATSSHIFPASITRLTVAAPRITTTNHTMTYGQLHWRGGSDGERQDEYVVLLGRYDVMILGSEKFQRELPIPQIQNVLGEIRILPMSVRSERTVPLCLIEEEVSELDDPKPEEFIASMSISLTGRDARLDFFAILRDSIRLNRNGQKNDHRDYNSFLPFIKYFDPCKDRFLLSEGAADVILLFYGGEKRYGDIINIQKHLRQFFLVNRVETCFSPNYLKLVSNQKTSEFGLSVDLRLNCDRNLSSTITIAERILKTSTQWLKGRSMQWGRIPGRLDYKIYIPPEHVANVLNCCKENIKCEDRDNPLNWILYLVGAYPSDHKNAAYTALIDEIITTIDYKFEENPLDDNHKKG